MLRLGSLSAAVMGWAFCLMLSILCSKRRPYFTELLALGIAGHLSGAWWVLPVIRHYSGIGELYGLVLFLLYAFFGALQFVAVGVLYAFFERRLNRSLAVLPVAWVTAEVLFPRVFPWTLGHTQLALSTIAQSADLFGAALISGLMLWWSSVILRCTAARGPVPGSAVACISLLAIISYGLVRPSSIEKAARTGGAVRIAAVQANLDPLVDFKSEQIEIVPAKYRELSFKTVTEVPLDLLVWPESSFWESYAPDVQALLPGAPGDPFPGLDVPLLFGGQTALNAAGTGKQQLFNSLFLVQRDRRFSSYHKQLLFPLGERIPLRELFPALEQFDRRPFRILPGPPNQQILTLPLKQGEARLGPAICYEDAFPELLRHHVQHGATLLVGISNDAWFLKTPAAEMHHALAAWTAIQLRRYLIRGTVDGITGIIDPLGRTADALPAHTAGVLVSDKVRLLELRSAYSYWGDAPLQIGSILILIGTAVYGRLKKTRLN